MLQRLCTLTVLVAVTLSAQFNDCLAGECDNCVVSCHSSGKKVCCTYAKPGTESKHCWEVECVEVCIPAIRWPWECWGKKKCSNGACDQVNCDGISCGSAAPLKCGKVKIVRRLKKVEYECDTCKYEHRIECRDPNCGCHGCLPQN